MASSAVAVGALPKQYSEASVWSHLVSRQKDFRLLSLKIAPEAFGSTYERELQFTWDTWESRPRSPQATTFVAVPGDTFDFRQVAQKEWLGQLVSFSMLQRDRAKLSANASSWATLKDGEMNDGAAAVHCHSNGMSVTPPARCKGIARKLIKHAIASSAPKNTASARYTVFAWAKNEPARRAFETCGFKVVGEEMYESGSHDQRRHELALMLEYESPR